MHQWAAKWSGEPCTNPAKESIILKFDSDLNINNETHQGMEGTYNAVPLQPTESYGAPPIYHPTVVLWDGIRDNFFWGLSPLNSPAKKFLDFSSLSMTLHQIAGNKWQVCAEMTAH